MFCHQMDNKIILTFVNYCISLSKGNLSSTFLLNLAKDKILGLTKLEGKKSERLYEDAF